MDDSVRGIGLPSTPTQASPPTPPPPPPRPQSPALSSLPSSLPSKQDGGVLSPLPSKQAGGVSSEQQRRRMESEVLHRVMHQEAATHGVKTPPLSPAGGTAAASDAVLHPDFFQFTPSEAPMSLVDIAKGTPAAVLQSAEATWKQSAPGDVGRSKRPDGRASAKSPLNREQYAAAKRSLARSALADSAVAAPDSSVAGMPVSRSALSKGFMAPLPPTNPPLRVSKPTPTPTPAPALAPAGHVGNGTPAAAALPTATTSAGAADDSVAAGTTGELAVLRHNDVDGEHGAYGEFGTRSGHRQSVWPSEQQLAELDFELGSQRLSVATGSRAGGVSTAAAPSGRSVLGTRRAKGLPYDLRSVATRDRDEFSLAVRALERDVSRLDSSTSADAAFAYASSPTASSRRDGAKSGSVLRYLHTAMPAATVGQRRVRLRLLRLVCAALEFGLPAAHSLHSATRWICTVLESDLSAVRTGLQHAMDEAHNTRDCVCYGKGRSARSGIPSPCPYNVRGAALATHSTMALFPGASDEQRYFPGIEDGAGWTGAVDGPVSRASAGADVFGVGAAGDTVAAGSSASSGHPPATVMYTQQQLSAECDALHAELEYLRRRGHSDAIVDKEQMPKVALEAMQALAGTVAQRIRRDVARLKAELASSRREASKLGSAVRRRRKDASKMSTARKSMQEKFLHLRKHVQVMMAARDADADADATAGLSTPDLSEQKEAEMGNAVATVIAEEAAKGQEQVDAARAMFNAKAAAVRSSGEPKCVPVCLCLLLCMCLRACVPTSVSLTFLPLCVWVCVCVCLCVCVSVCFISRQGESVHGIIVGGPPPAI